MNKKKVKLTLIKSGATEGYKISDIKEVLSNEKYKSFEKCIYGQTVGIYQGEDLIYSHDFYKFLRGLPVSD